MKLVNRYRVVWSSAGGIGRDGSLILLWFFSGLLCSIPSIPLIWVWRGVFWTVTLSMFLTPLHDAVVSRWWEQEGGQVPRRPWKRVRGPGAP